MIPSRVDRIAKYAWGEDYHRVFARKVRAFIETLPEITGIPDIGTRWYTDTGPMLDRAVAERAGVGWFGKNTNILTSQGSWNVTGTGHHDAGPPA